ncbi:hypothetical protein RRG43_02050, partial [Mycoplasmopsis cynos]
MKKYKKIFSGLGLLSITTLMGASIVACSPKEEKADKAKAEKEKADKAKAEKEKADKAKAEKEKADKAKAEKEK